MEGTFGRAKARCPNQTHKFVRLIPGKGKRLFPQPVGLKAPRPDDFCRFCRLTREVLIPKVEGQ